jgi:uncharacterized protein
MTRIIEDNKAAVEGLCRRFHVARLEVFGSAAEGTFDPQRSDLDFLVEFRPLEPGPLADAYFGLLSELQRLFDRKVDLVTPKAIRNPHFLKSVNATRKELYAA